ncbi:oral cancer overexpressed protein 1 [Striga asiatica]|uniref:Oral cancer overexpressed protein 1 n=1 Tax=Striga asiatica TaxID=4170 RepID=A0A5A7P981_STRAF|nr:oral cancer overexpressed protein 1 [Striga asiatica]
MNTGFEVAEDLAFYRGRVHVWSSAVRPDPNFFSARIQRTIKQVVHGRKVGLKMNTGFEVAEDLAFYRGRVHVWSSAVRPDPNFFSARIQRTIKQVVRFVYDGLTGD